MVERLRCPSCGAELPLGGAFCDQCGDPVMQTLPGLAPAKSPPRARRRQDRRGRRVVLALVAGLLTVAAVALAIYVATGPDLGRPAGPQTGRSSIAGKRGAGKANDPRAPEGVDSAEPSGGDVQAPPKRDEKERLQSPGESQKETERDESAGREGAEAGGLNLRVLSGPVALGGGREQAVLSAEEPSGRPVVDLTKDSITVARRVEEKTLPVQIESLTPQPNMSALAAVCFAVDTSSSMGYDKRLQSAGLALKELLAEIPEEVRVGLVRFGTGAELLCSVSGKRDSVVTALDALLPQGHTAFWDAVALCLEDLSGIQGRRGVVVLADGPDDIAPDRMGPVEQRAVDLGIPVYVVTLDMKQDAYAMLAELAAVSGSGAEGVGVVRLRSPNGIVDAYRGMLERLATVYRLTWRSPAPRGEGKGGKLVVSVDTTRGEKRAVGTVQME